jgi:hypothetical protein
MDLQKQAEIKQLAEDMHDKRLRFNNMAHVNIGGLPPEESKKHAVDYELARAEYYEARAALDAAMPASAKY